MDCGCTVQGYQSDISRTWVFGQEIALQTAKPGSAVGAIDDAVRRYYEREGWGPDCRLPGLSHRTGHEIGLDGHEPAYLVHGDSTPLEPGMCFSAEPGIYIPGEFRHTSGGLLAHESIGARAFHTARQVSRESHVSALLGCQNGFSTGRMQAAKL